MGDVPRSWFHHFHVVWEALDGIHRTLSPPDVTATALSITDTSTAPCHPLFYLHRLPGGVHSSTYTYRPAWESDCSTKTPYRSSRQNRTLFGLIMDFIAFSSPRSRTRSLVLLSCVVTQHNLFLVGIIWVRFLVLSYWQ